MADETADLGLNNPEVVAKYNTAADIANRTLTRVVEACVAGANILSLCQLGDEQIDAACKLAYVKSKGMSKGVAFPTCVSVNHVACNFSPLRSDPEAGLALNEGDVVKVELGAHIDGFAAITGHTLVIGASKDNPVTGPKADVLKAAYLASEAALRLLAPANKNEQVTATIQQVADGFGVVPVQGMLSHQLEQNVIDGKKSIILNPSDQQRNHPVAEFEQGEVWVVDVLLSTGSGKPKESTHRTTVYKKTGTTYMLKMKTSRAVFSEISTKFGKYPFSLRLLEDEKKARMGIQECANHYLVAPYQVFAEKEGEYVAQFTFTAMLTANGIVRLTSSLYDEEAVVSDKKIEDSALNDLLAVEVGSKKKKKKKKAGDGTSTPAE